MRCCSRDSPGPRSRQDLPWLVRSLFSYQPCGYSLAGGSFSSYEIFILSFPSFLPFLHPSIATPHSNALYGIEVETSHETPLLKFISIRAPSIKTLNPLLLNESDGLQDPVPGSPPVQNRRSPSCPPKGISNLKSLARGSFFHSPVAATRWGAPRRVRCSTGDDPFHHSGSIYLVDDQVKLI